MYYYVEKGDSNKIYYNKSREAKLGWRKVSIECFLKKKYNIEVTEIAEVCLLKEVDNQIINNMKNAPHVSYYNMKNDNMEYLLKNVINYRFEDGILFVHYIENDKDKTLYIKSPYVVLSTTDYDVRDISFKFMNCAELDFMFWTSSNYTYMCIHNYFDPKRVNKLFNV